MEMLYHAKHFLMFNFIFVSEIYSIFDCIVIDTCLDATKYTGWNNLNNRLQVSYDEDGRLLSNSSGSIGAYTLSAPDTSQTGLYDYDWQYPYCIEFDVTALSNFTIQIKDANEHQGEMPFSNVNNVHIKFNVTATSLTATVGETSKNPVTVNFDDLTTIVFIISNGNSMKFKDLRVYPI